MNVVIDINFRHSHRINVASAYKLLRCDPTIKDMFKEYFEQGMTAAIAKNYHEVNILDLQGSEGIANAQQNPTYRQVRHLYDIWRKKNLGGRSNQDVLTVLKQLMPVFSKKGVNVHIKEDPMIIVIITPIMRRLFLRGYSDEIVYIDSSGSCDQTSTRVTFIFASLKIGAAPIACVLHTDETEANYTLAFMAVKEALESGNDKKIQPSVIMTDDSEAERNALKCVYPKSSLLLCHFHVCQAVWRWLWLSEHKVDKCDRKIVMKAFQDVLYASDEETATRNFTNLTSDAVAKGNEIMINYFSKLWSRKVEWCLCYRNDLLTRGNNTNNYVEASIRIFKDVVLQRSKVFNSCALVKFIVDNFENYHKLRLLEFAHSRRNKDAIYMKYLLKTQGVKEYYKVNEMEYKVQSEKDASLSYTVSLDIGCCECPQGRSGKYCKHLCFLENKLNIAFRTSPKIASGDRKEFAKLALGDLPSEDFYLGLDIKNENLHEYEDDKAQIQEPIPSTSRISSDIVIIPSESAQKMKITSILKLTF